MQTDVTFPSNGITIAGTLYTPDDHTGGPLPGVVVGHPFGSVRQQSPANYAERLARKGFAALTFDAAYQGESGGEPRFKEDPFQRAEDVRAAVSYLTTRDDIDAERIGALGICASGGYVPFAAQTDHRIKAIATVSGADIGKLFREGMGGGQDPAVLAGMLDTAAKLRTAEAQGAEPHLERGVPNTPEDADAFPKGSMYNEAYDYYRTPRGQHPNSPNWWLFRTIDQVAQFDAYGLIDLLAPRPLLMIAGSEADTRYFSEDAVSAYSGPGEVVIIDGATHIDMYDKPQYVDPASEKIVDFFGKHLAA
ncbi:alpha/beta hydrolase [Streptomyces fractus]|uniref:alpha/beta hydrolase n=1 Tax=Streptomyces fractus TaxID=641806 RepID=UPI003CED22E1